MKGVSQTWLVATREVRERSRSRAFLASVVLMIIVVAGAIVLPGLLDTDPGTKDVGLTGVVPSELPAAIQAQGTAVNTTARLHRFDTLAAGEQAVRDGAIDVLVVDARQLEWRRRADEQLKAVVTGAIQLNAVRERAVAAGINPDELLAMVAPVEVDNVELSQVTGRSADDENAAFIMTLLLFGTITTYGTMVLSGVVEEKSSRTVEVLLARMPARNLLAGKIAGIGALGLAQIGVTAVVALVAGAMVDAVDIPAVRGGVVAWAVVWFVLGYALYATVFGTLGSLASRTEDASSVAGPVTVVLILGFMLSFAAIGSADTAWARLVAWFPITAPFAMPNRIAMGAATWWDPLVAVALTLGAIAGLIILGGRIYTRAILHTGATLTLAQAWRGEPVHAGTVAAATAPRPTEAPSERARPTPAPTNTANDRLINGALIAIGLAVGAAVYLVANDIIVAVAIGAGLYALAIRLARHQHARR